MSLKAGETNINQITLLLLLGLFLSLTGCGVPGNPTAKDILDDYPEADIIKLDDLIYLKTTNPESEPSDGYSKGAKIGEIKKTTTNALLFGNLNASKLPKGTEVFSTDEDYQSGDPVFTILVEIDGELIAYHVLLEG